MVPYVVGAVLSVTVMRLLLFVFDVSMLKGCDGDDNAAVGDGGGFVAVSVGYEYVGGTRDSGSVTIAADVLKVFSSIPCVSG